MYLPTILYKVVEEAQIGGKLQHFGVVSVYELGCSAGRSPCFTAKLVNGRSLAALPMERPDVGEDVPRFLTIFEAEKPLPNVAESSPQLVV